VCSYRNSSEEKYHSIPLSSHNNLFFSAKGSYNLFIFNEKEIHFWRLSFDSLAHYLLLRRRKRKRNMTEGEKRILIISNKKNPSGYFSCLIMDVNFPEMKGYEAVSIIKNIAPMIKIIMTTKKNIKRLEAKVREQNVFFIS